VRRAGTEFLRRRAMLVAPAMLILVSALWFSGEPRNRVDAVAACLLTMFAFFVGEAVVLRRRQLSESYLLMSMLVTQGGITLVGIATGGLQSPVVPLLFAPTGVGLAAFGRSGRGRTVLVGLLVSLLALGVGASFPGWPPLGSPLREAMAVAASVLCAVLLYAAIGSLSDAYVVAGNALLRTQNTLLRAATSRATDLEAMGARVSHELKNPLAAAKGLVELVRRHCQDNQKERLDVALTELERIQTTLQDYLAFSRPLGPLRLVSFDLRTWLQELVSLHEGLAAAAGVTLVLEGSKRVAASDSRTSSAESLGDWVGDRTRLGEALSNLISNAVQACDVGDEVVVRSRRDALGLSIEVEDSGQGMAPEMLARLGTPFLTGKPGGTGLGVVLARTAITQHAGRLVFESATGSGTRALVELPLLNQDESTP
jgi:signal transduction histidine kinase